MAAGALGSRASRPINNGIRNGNNTFGLNKKKNMRQQNTKNNKKASYISRAIFALVLLMVIIEYVAYTSLTLPISEPPKESEGRYFESRQKGKALTLRERMRKKRVEEKLRTRERRHKEKQKILETYRNTSPDPAKVQKYDAKYKNIHTSTQTDVTNNLSPEEFHDQRIKTVEHLLHMGVEEDYDLEELPPWSLILDNFHPQTKDDEPIILGLEYCEDFRKMHSPKIIGVGPAGLFSTGTNLIANLMTFNCDGPLKRRGNRKKFSLVQVPWGKHNPADARFHHQVPMPVVEDREAILPVVAIRHPYTWMSAMCKHSYNTRWRHVHKKCHRGLGLENPVWKVPYGFKSYNETHNVTNSYNSLAHMWMEWYKPYFLDEKYNQTPRLMVRHEDMVYRPEKVVSRICECVGGVNSNPIKDWEDPDGFQYLEEGANTGGGHGIHRSGLLTAILKYGQPLRNWYDQYTATDREIMKEAFQGEVDPELRNIFDTFQYKLYDDVAGPTPHDIIQVERRKAMEEEKDEQVLAEAKAVAKRNGDLTASQVERLKAHNMKQQRKNAKKGNRGNPMHDHRKYKAAQ
ncbi:unnamed protein product [Pseudo-nitzschia multistriata]|uniref:Sulfotransferase domain-containing protein n=1 Tax=Pseudo-nitzschia multistriata TaxID=183589 RepID=A0A448ZTH4_9STRA|nr:unnamed protein product [Pseudo-nitzschia multistriata]